MSLKRYIWLTDTHFNFLDQATLVGFFLGLEAKKVNGLFLTGDISTGPDVVKHLMWLDKVVKTPIYFVLGNHDYYRSTFAQTEQAMTGLMQSNDNLHYLTACEPISLSQDVALIGHDGWYDAGWRDPMTTAIFVWDWYFIKDFRSLFGTEERMALVKGRAKEAAEFIADKLKKALKNHSTVYMLTHFPPWPEESDKFYGLLEKFWMPYNSSKMMADCVSDIMDKHPDKKLVILAGHTHIKRNIQISHNIELRVGDAEFGKPQVQDIISF